MPPFENETNPLLRLLSSYAAQCLAALIVVGLLVGCGQDAAAPAAPAPVSVHMLTVEPRKVPIRFDIVGQIEGSKQVEVRARVPGILQKQFYNEGDSVKEGAPLFEIDRATYEVALAQARAQLAQATAQVDQARREEARLKPLLQDRAVSGKEYDDATSSRQLAEAAIQQANASIRQAELNLSYTRVTAPVAGVSGRAEHSIGTLIATDVNGSLLTTINQMSTVWVRFSLAQADLAKLPGGYINRSTPVVLELLLPDGSPYPLKGRLNFAATSIDTRLGTQQLRAEFFRDSSSPSALLRASATGCFSCRRPRLSRPKKETSFLSSTPMEKRRRGRSRPEIGSGRTGRYLRASMPATRSWSIICSRCSRALR